MLGRGARRRKWRRGAPARGADELRESYGIPGAERSRRRRRKAETARGSRSSGGHERMLDAIADWEPPSPSGDLEAAGSRRVHQRAAFPVEVTGCG